MVGFAVELHQQRDCKCYPFHQHPLLLGLPQTLFFVFYTFITTHCSITAAGIAEIYETIQVLRKRRRNFTLLANNGVQISISKPPWKRVSSRERDTQVRWVHGPRSFFSPPRNEVILAAARTWSICLRKLQQKHVSWPTDVQTNTCCAPFLFSSERVFSLAESGRLMRSKIFSLSPQTFYLFFLLRRVLFRKVSWFLREKRGSFKYVSLKKCVTNDCAKRFQWNLLCLVFKLPTVFRNFFLILSFRLVIS